MGECEADPFLPRLYPEDLELVWVLRRTYRGQLSRILRGSGVDWQDYFSICLPFNHLHTFICSISLLCSLDHDDNRPPSWDCSF